MNITLLGAARQPATTYAKPCCVFAPVDHVILANMPCACHDTVILLFSFCTALFTYIGADQIIAPACPGTHGKVILTIVADMIICCAIVDKVDVIITTDTIAGSSILDKVDVIILADVTAGFSPCDGVEFKIATGAMASLATRDRVEFKIATDAMASFATHNRVDLKIATDAMAGSATHDGVDLKIADGAMATHNRVDFKIVADVMTSCATHDKLNVTSGILFQRDQTSVYDVKEYPFFVLSSRQSESLSFSETFRVYACHFSNYRLVYIIEFIFCWSNHLCYFVSQHMEMLVNFDLTPQQHCQRAYLSICRSQYYRHDFAIISSVGGLSAIYVVADFVKIFRTYSSLDNPA